MDTEGKIRHLFDLFAKFGHENYIGEEVSQLQHAQVRGRPLMMSDFLGGWGGQAKWDTIGQGVR